MPYFLRAIHNNVNWEKTQFPKWLNKDELPSCVVRDLRADDNALSLWEIQDDKSNLPNVVAAIASTRDGAKDNFDYALLNKTDLEKNSFMPSYKVAETAYLDINQFHRDISNLTLNQVVFFAYLLNQHAIFDRMGWKKIEAHLKEAVKNKQLDFTKLKNGLKKRLGISK